MIAALLVIAIHTSPLTSVNEGADFFLTRVLARIAVPFFLMVTGQFAASAFLVPAPGNGRKLLKYEKKMGLLYAFSILLYLPIGIYAGHYQEINAGALLRMLLFDGTFYHLWYFPACMLGMLVVFLMSRVMGLRAMTAVSTLLYLIGLFGDSYFGLVQKVPALEAVYEFFFRICSYTRNGLFLAPMFLVLGMWMYDLDTAREEDPDEQLLPLSIMGLALSFSVMTIEAFVLRHFQLQRHDSMYIALIPTMFFLYQCLLCLPKKPARGFRIVSTWIYILHPAFIVVVRALAKLLHQTALLVDNSMVHYLAVALLSVAAGFGAVYLRKYLLPVLPLHRNQSAGAAESTGKSRTSHRPSQKASYEEDENSSRGRRRKVSRRQKDRMEEYDGQETEFQQDIDAGYDEIFYGRPDAGDYDEHTESGIPDEYMSDSGMSDNNITTNNISDENVTGNSTADRNITENEIANTNMTDYSTERSISAEENDGINVSNENVNTAAEPKTLTVIADKTVTNNTMTDRNINNQTISSSKINTGNTESFSPRSIPEKKKNQPSARPQKPSHCSRAWIELDAAALAHNVSVLRSRLPGQCRLMPAVKADAYGHGAALISNLLNQLDVDAFCVACLSEGIALREADIKGEILILGYTSPKDFPLLLHYRLTQAVIDYDYAQELEQFGETLHVHLAIDTGMHRLGVRCENIEEILAVYEMKHLAIDGLFTHLAASDSPLPQDRAFTDSQIQAFYQVVDILESRGYACQGLHLLSSYGILNLLPERKKQDKSSRQPAPSLKYLSDLAADYVRPGIALYGVLSTKEDCDNLQDLLWPVLSLKAKVISSRTLYAGEAAGYGMAFTARQDMRIAALAIGYADGLPRELSNGRGYVLIEGRQAPIIGRICMDQTIVDVSNIPNLHIGDTAVLIGKSGAQAISAGDLAQQCGTITNELLSRLGARLERFVLSENL